jgi:hypothetical protein
VDPHQRVVVVEVVLGVELVALDVLPPMTKPPDEPLAGPVLPGVPPLPLVAASLPDVLPAPEPDGLVVLLLDELVPEVPAASLFLLQALSESAPTTASVAIATCVRDVFIRKLLEDCLKFARGTT